MALVLAISTAIVALPLDSEAARMGGGRSIGNRSTMSQPMGSTSTYSSSSNSYSAGAGTAAMSRSSGMGGMLGGFLGGALLGSMLGGHSAATGQAGEGAAAGDAGFGLMDLVLIFLVIWLVMRFIRRRQASQQGYGRQGYGQQQGYDDQQGYGMQRSSQGSAWDQLRGDQGSMGGMGAPRGASGAQGSIPADFNTEEFLRGAKMAYSRMQDSWDRRDLNDIASFATFHILQDLQAQMREEPEPTKTEIYDINARLLSVEESGSMELARVLFDVRMTENPRQVAPYNVREVWTFMRDQESPNWKLDAIQQMS